MASLRLERLSAANHDATAAVRITEEQRAHLDTQSFAAFLDEAPLHPTFEVQAVMRDEVVVGFVSYGHLPQDPRRWWIPLVGIDEAHQRRGHGRAALQLVIADVRRRAPDATALGLSYRPANLAAARLYRSLGFERSGLDERGEVVAWLTLATT